MNFRRVGGRSFLIVSVSLIAITILFTKSTLSEHGFVDLFEFLMIILLGKGTIESSVAHIAGKKDASKTDSDPDPV